MLAEQEATAAIAAGQAGQAGQAGLFNYDELEAEAQDFVRDSTQRILTIAKRMTREMVEIGGLLVQVKDRITPTQFDAWVSTKLHWSERTVYNLMTVHLKFRDADFALENVAASALYLLAAPSTPAKAVEAVKEMANAGSVSHAAVKEIVQQAKEAQEAALRPALFVEPDAETCRCGHSERQHDNVSGCLVCECEGVVPATPAEEPEAEDVEEAEKLDEAPVAIPAQESTLKPAQAAPVAAAKPETSTPAAKPTKIAPTTDEMKLAAAQDVCWRQVTVRLAVSLLPVKGDGPRTAMVNVNLPDHMDLMKAAQVPEDQAPAKLEELTALVKAALYEKAQKTKAVKPAAKPATKPAAKPAAKKKAARK